MGLVLFVTHPEVVVDPATPVPEWGLSEQGVRRMRAFAASLEAADLTAIWSSEEAKAVQAADLLAERSGLTVERLHALHENDRSATGFLPPPAFEAMADAFFASPEESVRGWERAIDAQARITAAFDHVLAASPAGKVAIVSHGAVGTLLLCRLTGQLISRAADQPFQGHYWAYDSDSRSVLHGWRPIAPR